MTASDKSIGIGMIGCGTVGGGVARLLSEQADLYARRLGRSLVLRRVLVRDVNKANREATLPPGVLTDDADAFFATDDMAIVIEVAGGTGPAAQFVRRAIESGRHVVTANKSLLASQGPDLYALAREHGVSIAFEASCGEGISIVAAFKGRLMANRVDAMYGILNGTCNYILTQMTQKGESYSDALREAKRLGYAEADPTLDVSGRDAAEKLAILASLAFGVRVHETQVWSEGIDTLDLDDIKFGAELGYDIKLLAIGERTDSGVSLRVHPCFIHRTEPLAQVHGSFNALSVFGHAVGHTMYFGRGAGQMPTASAVVSDVINVAAGWYAQAFATLAIWPDLTEPVAPLDPADLMSRFYLRIRALDVPGVMAKVSAILGNAGISLSAILQHESDAGQFVPLVVTTHAARQGAVLEALDQLASLDEIDSRPVCIRIVDLPEG